MRTSFSGTYTIKHFSILNENKNYKQVNHLIIWHFCRYVPRGGGTRSFEMPGVTVKNPESSKTVCNLRHCPVTLTHLSRLTEGSYRCEISTEAPKFRLYFDTANISIVGMPFYSPSSKQNHSSKISLKFEKLFVLFST